MEYLPSPREVIIINPKIRTAKKTSLGSILKVQEVIDYLVLSELSNKDTFAKQIEQNVQITLGGAGVTLSHLSLRIQQMINQSLIEYAGLDPGHKSIRLLRITAAGSDHLRKITPLLEEQIENSIKTYTKLLRHIKQNEV